ncbi:2-octaprenyl-6-methoxyphenyl hydroxylase [Pasteurella sp. PK-2025]|uniref:2-octaprenyl-6-methoxyphenyl hydroxylase n=1 Tax=Pasteurella sp. PK-2025 TaxID=3413133 RepID=UPI003C73A8A3
MQQTHYDVVIVGGAMTGVTLALSLSHQTDGNMKIAILEKQATYHHQQGGFDARCIALSDGSCQRLAQITLPHGNNLWQLAQPLSCPIQKIHVSDKGHSGLTEFHAEEFHLDQLGAVVELNQMGKMLLDALRDYPNVDYLSPVEITDIQRSEHNVKISLKNDRTLITPLLVGADGSQSIVAKSANIAQICISDYQQTAIITNVLPQQDHQFRAFERFTDEGPIALLPMQDNLMSLVWCVKNPDALMQLEDSAFLQALQQRFGWRLGKFLQCGKRFAYPLKLYQAEQHVQHRIALVGNAAQTLHPIAGQGFNLGIRDVVQLSDCLATSYNTQSDLGSYAQLQVYETARQRDQQHIMHLTDGLVSIFANQLLPLQLGRTFGLMTLAQSTKLRQLFAKPTLGWI